MTLPDLIVLTVIVPQPFHFLQASLLEQFSYAHASLPLHPPATAPMLFVASTTFIFHVMEGPPHCYS